MWWNFRLQPALPLGRAVRARGPGEEGKPLCGEPGTETKLVLKAGKEAATGPQLLSVIGLCVLGPVGGDRACQLCVPAERATGAVISPW